jgi:hypothetical protein
MMMPRSMSRSVNVPFSPTATAQGEIQQARAFVHRARAPGYEPIFLAEGEPDVEPPSARPSMRATKRLMSSGP